MRSKSTQHDAGFTLIEVLVATLILSIGIIAVIGSLAYQRGLTSRSEIAQTAITRAEQQIEYIQSLAYANVALSSTPGTSTDPNNPNYYVTSGTTPTYQYNHSSGATNSPEPLDIDSTNGQLAPGPTSWSDGRLSGNIYNYVTWVTDSNCGAGCPTSQNYKRVTVAVTVNSPTSTEYAPVIESVIVTDPNASPSGEVTNGTENPLSNPTTTCTNSQGTTVACTNGLASGTANIWYLYDTPATNTTRQTITGNHAVHATVAATGTCSKHTTSGCPVPDLMGSTAPPAQTPSGLFNYSTNITGYTYTGGRAILPDVACSATPTSTNNNDGELWVTDPLTSSLTFSGDGGLTLYTQTLSAATGGVTLCAQIYDVPNSITNLVSSPPTTLGTVSYTPPTWPASAQGVSFTFDFLSVGSTVTVPSGDRIGLRIWPAATSAEGIAAIYDNTLYPSLLQLNSQ